MAVVVVSDVEFEAWSRVGRTPAEQVPSCPSCGAHEWRSEWTGNRSTRSATVVTWCGRCHRSSSGTGMACARNLPESITIREKDEPSAVPADIQYVMTEAMAKGLARQAANRRELARLGDAVTRPCATCGAKAWEVQYRLAGTPAKRVGALSITCTRCATVVALAEEGDAHAVEHNDAR